jgi:hypothetical protein
MTVAGYTTFIGCFYIDLHRSVAATNTKKTKEMIIHFGKKLTIDSIPPLTIDGDRIERVSYFKLLGVIISSDLSWEQHVSYILKKVSKRYYIIFQLSRIGIPHHDIILIYCSIISSLLEYACPVCQWSPTTLSDDIGESKALHADCLSRSLLYRCLIRIWT